MKETVVGSIKTLLIETFEGPRNDGNYFTNTNSKNGIFRILDDISAEEASSSINGSTIASHSDHIRYYLWVVRQLISGTEFEKNWESSWEISHVNEKKWTEIKKGLKDEYITLMKEIDKIDLEEWLTNVLGTIAHSTYHLGSLRQMVKAIESKSKGSLDKGNLLNG